MRHFYLAAAVLLTGCGGSGNSALPANQAPTVTAPTSIVVPANGSTAVEFEVTDDSSPIEALRLTVESDQLVLLPEDQLSIEGESNTRTLNLTPTVDEFGAAVLTLTAQDTEGLASSHRIAIEVAPEQLPLEGFVREQFMRDSGATPALVNAVVFDDDVLENALDDLL